MPNFFPEGNTPLPTDSEERSLLKAVSLLETIASGSGGGGGGGGHSGSTFYEIKSANFTAEIGKNYAVDTTSGVVSVSLPTNPQPGEFVGFADAKGTWGTNPITILRNGKNIEGSQINFSNNASGTFFVVLFIDSATGWRVLTSGTKPLNLTPPTVSGTYDFSSTNGTWTGSPTSFSYQWQMSTNGTSGWTNINGATSSTYTALEADEGKYVRIGVVATNSNGPSVVTYSAASAAINVPDFPTSGLLAFWKLDDVNDSSGNNYTLTNNNSVTFNSGKIGNAAYFQGNGSSLSRSFSLNTSEMTVSFWVKNTQTDVGQLDLIGQWSGGGWLIHITLAGIAFYAPSVVYGTTGVVNGLWRHIVATRSATTSKIFVDGVEYVSGNSGGGAVNTSTNLFIGNPNYQIELDAVGIWDRVLTTEEIAQLYNSGNGVEP